MAHDRLRDTAQQGSLHSPASVAAEHDDIRRPFVRGLDDLGGGLPDLDEFQDRWCRRHALTDGGQQSPAIALGLGNQLSRGNTTVGRIAERRVDGMDKRYLGSERLCKLNANIRRMGRNRAGIYGDKDSTKARGDLPPGVSRTALLSAAETPQASRVNPLPAVRSRSRSTTSSTRTLRPFLAFDTGNHTVRTPFLNSALARSISAPSGSGRIRRPDLPGESSSARFGSASITSTLSVNSTLTCSFLMPGRSAITMRLPAVLLVRMGIASNSAFRHRIPAQKRRIPFTTELAGIGHPSGEASRFATSWAELAGDIACVIGVHERVLTPDGAIRMPDRNLILRSTFGVMP